MPHPRCLITSLFICLLLFTGGCAPASQSASYPNQAYPGPVGSLNTAVPQVTASAIASATARQQAVSTRLRPTITNIPHRYHPTTTDVPPEWFYTATPDPKQDTIVVKIVGNYSQEEITRILYAKWLDHFLDKSISEAFRLEEYAINGIDLPADQKCAKVPGGLFFALADATLKTTLPIVSHDFKRSAWSGGSGNLVDDYRITKPFSGVVYKDGDTYTLKVIFQSPPC